MERSIDRAAREMLGVAKERGLVTAWDRYEAQTPQCRFGASGLCCRICVMGPCRIVEGKSTAGVCGAGVDTIAARNLVRMIAAGAAAHSDHGRDVAHTLLSASRDGDYTVKDPVKLRRVAYSFGIEAEGKDDRELAREVAEAALAEFGKQEGELLLAYRAPEPRVERWRRLGIMPRGIDREVVEIMHRTTMGVDADYRNIILQGMRCALADGWGGSMIATDLQDVLFGTPSPLRARVNLGVLDPEAVNIVVHGHEPTLSEMIVLAARDPELRRLAEEVGARGINIAGICCTANEILMRHGIPVAGNFLHQELAVMTGVVDAMVVDVQCIMPALSDLVKHFHTVLITTSPKAAIPGAEHVEFSEDRALEVAKEIVRKGIENFPRRNGGARVPDEAMDLIAGFTAESVFYFLGGRYRATYRPLNDAIIDGRLRGVAGIVGCNNPKITQDFAHVEMTKELIKHDVLVVTTGCAAIADAKAGLLRPEVAFELAGKGLQEICEAVGIPPVLHLGACVDNSRILIALTNMVHEGGLGDDISDIPVAGAAPEWMSEKAVAIGFYFVASGVFTVLGQPFPVTASEALMKFLTEDIEELVGGKFAFEPDPIKAAHLMIEHIDRKRHALKLREPMYA
ncbi:MAG: anaerobic carbon-monoxide dehydrogenase catalytic subunit [Caldiserica bacterium]|nr:anaerobic carbon-monoxide dehydrogenase catalytic subunit [Caldisericota bacterium]